MNDVVNGRLSERTLEPAIQLFGLDDPMTVRQLNDMGLLNAELMLEEVVKKRYDDIVRDYGNIYTFDEITDAIARAHGLHQYEVIRIVRYRRDGPVLHCTRCGAALDFETGRRTGGLCSTCAAEELAIKITEK